MNVFLRFRGFKFIFSTFVKRKNMSFICGEHRVWKFRRKNSSLYVQTVFWHALRFLTVVPGEVTKNRFFCAFSSIFFYICVVCSWFFVWRNKLCQTHLLDILIILIRRIENFLRGCEKQVLSEKWGFSKHSLVPSQPHFQSENPNFFTFPNI